MENDSIFESDHAQELVDIIVDGALKKYKIDPDRAEHIVIETMQKFPKFMGLLEEKRPLKQILKNRYYDEVNHKAKHDIYYELRQYTQNIEAQNALVDTLSQLPDHSPESDYLPIIEKLAHSHISTKERMHNIDDFYGQVFQIIGEPETIIDIGCGMNPLLYPFNGKGKKTWLYAALDKDETCVEALSAYSEVALSDRLVPQVWNIEEDWEEALEKLPVAQFDTAFFMKLIPVVFRIERDLLDILQKTPAKTWVITGSKISMTKFLKIERRERKIINRFIEDSGKKIKGEFSTLDEFCIIVE